MGNENLYVIDHMNLFGMLIYDELAMCAFDIYDTIHVKQS